MKRHCLRLTLALFLCAMPALAQQPPGPPGMDPTPPPMQPNRPPMERAMHAGPPRIWWKNPDLVKKLGLTDDQQTKMDQIFQDSRLKLIDLHASLEKEEAILDPLLSSDQPDESKIVSQIDRVAQARGELEKANARMLLGLRRILTADQWKKLSAEAPMPGRGGHDHGDGHFGGPPPGPPPQDGGPPAAGGSPK
jgi:Spy/CpxP family protein refolding chaperone